MGFGSGIRRSGPPPPTRAQNVHEVLLKRLRAENPRKVLFKGPIMHPNPSNDQKMLQTARFRYVLMMVLDGLRFLEFAAHSPAVWLGLLCRGFVAKLENQSPEQSP
jgi:hypothetical protein